MNKILEEDINEIVSRCSVFGERFFHKTFLITGSTGLVGSLIVRSLLRMNDKFDSDIKIIITTRDKERAKLFFDDERIKIYNNEEPIVDEINYIIHCASPTQSRIYVEEPVETMDAIIFGTRKMLELAREKNVEKFLYISSMEVYGTVVDEDMVNENKLGFVSLKSVRSSYPEGKRVAELYMYAFSQEYEVPAISARLAMCFGAGIREDDHRVHKSFCEDALSGRDIVMKSSGSTVVNYVYIVDAIVALFTLLINGDNGEAYNVSGDMGGETIFDMAEMIAKMGGVKVRREIDEDNRLAPDNLMMLDNSKMKELGWEPRYNLAESLSRLYQYLED